MPINRDYLRGSRPRRHQVPAHSADGDGGGAYLHAGSDLGFAIFSSNTAGWSGGGISARKGPRAWSEHALHRHAAGSPGGGGVYITGAGTSVEISSCFDACDPTTLPSQRFLLRVPVQPDDQGPAAPDGHRRRRGRGETHRLRGKRLSPHGEAVSCTKLRRRPPCATRSSIDHVEAMRPRSGARFGTLAIYSSTFSNNAFP